MDSVCCDSIYNSHAMACPPVREDPSLASIRKLNRYNGVICIRLGYQLVDFTFAAK